MFAFGSNIGSREILIWETLIAHRAFAEIGSFSCVLLRFAGAFRDLGIFPFLRACLVGFCYVFRIGLSIFLIRLNMVLLHVFRSMLLAKSPQGALKISLNSCSNRSVSRIVVGLGVSYKSSLSCGTE
jgi:hypothetical protein